MRHKTNGKDVLTVSEKTDWIWKWRSREQKSLRSMAVRSNGGSWSLGELFAVEKE